MAIFNVIAQENVIRIVAESGTEAARASAVAAAEASLLAASNAADTVNGFSAVATDAIEVLNDVGAVQVALAAEQVGLAVNAVASQRGLAIDGTLSPLSEVFGGINQTTLASNVGVWQIAQVNGSNFVTGDEIAALAWHWACAADTTRTEIRVWARDVAGATGAGTINNAAPVATHDNLILTFDTTPAALGITPGTSVPARTRLLNLPAPIVTAPGKDYIFQFRNFNASNAAVNCGFMGFAVAAGSQRQAGYQALTATPTTFTNVGATRTAAITIYRRNTATALGATDAQLRTLFDRKMEETLAAMNQRNVSNLLANIAAYPNVLAVPASFWGDSLVADVAGGLPSAFRATQIVDDLSSGTVNNYGISGQNASQITARVVAASAGDKAGFNLVIMGANDSPAGKSAAAIVTDFAACAAAFTNPNFVFCSTWINGLLRPRDRDVWRSLVTTYGAKAWDSAAVWARHGAFSSDAASALRGSIPHGLTVDNIHNNQAGGILKGYEWAAMTFARNGGTPYLHDEVVGMTAGAAAGSAITTVRTLGAAFNYQIIAGNEDGAVQIDRATGAITRTAQPILQPYREVFVEAENNRGRGRNGRIIIGQQMDGTNPQSAVRFNPNGAAVAQMPSTYAPADSTGITIVVCARLDPSRTTGLLLSQGGSSGIVSRLAGGLSFSARTSAAAILGSLNLSPRNPSDWHFYFFAVDTAAGWVRGAVDETTSSAVATAGNIGHAACNYLFTNISNLTPFGDDLKMMAVYDQAYDVSDSAVRAAFYDSTTRLPKDIGNGSAGGAFAQPLIYMRGMAGDYMLGKNYGTGGDLHVPIPIGPRFNGFVDLQN